MSRLRRWLLTLPAVPGEWGIEAVLDLTSTQRADVSGATFWLWPFLRREASTPKTVISAGRVVWVRRGGPAYEPYDQVRWDAGSPSGSEEEDQRLDESFPRIDVYRNVLISHHLHLDQWPNQTPTLNGAWILLRIFPYISIIQTQSIADYVFGLFGSPPSKPLFRFVSTWKKLD